jgi:hypothetical protein
MRTVIFVVHRFREPPQIHWSGYEVIDRISLQFSAGASARSIALM